MMALLPFKETSELLHLASEIWKYVGPAPDAGMARTAVAVTNP
jgi:hypothetical protein